MPRIVVVSVAVWNALCISKVVVLSSLGQLHTLSACLSKREVYCSCFSLLCALPAPCLDS